MVGPAQDALLLAVAGLVLTAISAIAYFYLSRATVAPVRDAPTVAISL